MDTIVDKVYVEALLELLTFEKDNNIRNGLYDSTQALMSYHSNKIEGSTLSYNDTWELYDSGKISSEQDIRAQDISDAQGHFLMFDRMINTLDHPINKELICGFHDSLKSGSYIDRKRGYAIGEYKKLNNAIAGIIQTTDVSEVEEEMESFFERYHNLCSVGQTIKSLATNHVTFEKIHPFQDGNGRVGRMLLFRQCIDAGIVPCLVTEELSKAYKDSLKMISTGGADIQCLADVLEKASLEYKDFSSRYVTAYLNQREDIPDEQAEIRHKRGR